MTRHRLAVALGVIAASLTMAAAVAAGRSAQPATTYRLDLLAHVDPGGGPSADVWGHGHYAYLSSYRTGCPALGVRIFDLSNPRQPKLVGTFGDKASEPALFASDTEKTIVKTVKTPSFKGDLAVTGFQGCGTNAFRGFGVYDVTNPAAPKRLALVDTGRVGVHELWLTSVGAHAYAYLAMPYRELLTSPTYDPATQTATKPGDPDFQIYDVTNPRHPVKLGGWGAFKALGLNPEQNRFTRGIGRATFAHSVITNAKGTRAFVSYWDLGTVLLDVSNPSRPRYLGHTTFSGGEEGDAHSAALAKSGKVLVETHEAPRADVPSLIDISNPRRPRKLADFRLPASIPPADAGVFGGVHDPKVVGNRVYFSWYKQGVVVADISNPKKPAFVAQFAPSPSPEVWGVYPTKSYILASDINSGLWVLRLSRIAAR